MAALASLLVLTALLLSPMPAPARAADLGPTTEADSARGLGPAPEVLGPGRWHRSSEGRTWYGAYRSLEDGYAYCVDAGRATPLPRFFRDSAPREIASPQTAWALHAYGDSEERDVHSALSAIAKLDPAVPHRHVIDPAEPSALGPGFRGAAAAKSRISKEAARFAGPYTLEIDIAAPPRGSLRTTARIHVESASGNAVPGLTVDLEATGGTVAAAAVTTAAEPVEVEVTVFPPAMAYGTPGSPLTDSPDTAPAELRPEIRLSARASGIPPTTVRFHEAAGPGSARVQNIISADAPQSVTADRRLVLDPVPVPSEEASPPPRPEHPSVPTAEPSPTAPPAPEPSTAPSPSTPPAPPAPAPTASPEPSTPPTSAPVPTSTQPAPAEPGSPAPAEPGSPAPAEPVPTGSTTSPLPTDPSGTDPSGTDPSGTEPADTEPSGTAPAVGPAPERDSVAAPTSAPSPRTPAAPETAGADELPRTGAGSHALIGLALVLVGTGTGALVLSGRRRR
ncbi:hypothetical protein [Brevibacterium ihuae]|uniref:hypothetical protein n=1 Tax=Brevibacterium ihuae TaxID=1631743 RepID=UPI0011AF0FB9|nr:hypothetical protein [Brevibacterium ihuae]